jgi:hypothetical protein
MPMNRTPAGLCAALFAALFAVTLFTAALMAGCSSYDPPTRPATVPPSTVVFASGDIATRVADFRALLGDPANGGTAGEQTAGRREVNWDGAGARPFNNRDDFPNDFFNNVVKAGLVYDGAAFRNDSLAFSEINPTYAGQFKAFSPPVLFSAIGTNVINAEFRVAGAATRAVVTGFGVVFSDVDMDNSSSLELFDKDGRSLGRFVAESRTDGNGFSFVGVKFDTPIIARVMITCGSAALGAGVNDITDGGPADLVVVDNVMYGEPHAF